MINEKNNEYGYCAIRIIVYNENIKMSVKKEREGCMTKYIENVNAYLNHMKIKQTYISFKTGIDKNKLSRILKGIQDITSSDMEKISEALGQKTQFFLAEPFYTPPVEEYGVEKIVFYAGDPTEEQDEIAEKLKKLMENIDEVMSAKDRFLNISEE